MADIIRESFVYRLFVAVGAWFGEQWRRSRIIQGFLDTRDEEEVLKNSIFSKAGVKLRDILSGIFSALRLDRLLRGSIFAKPFVWAFIAMTAAPIVPTMVLLALVAVSVLSFIISMGNDRQKKLHGAPVNRYILLYAFMYIIATFMSVTLKGSLFIGMLTFMFILSVFAAENSVDTRFQLKILVNGLVAAGTLVALYGVYQYVFNKLGTDTWVDEEMFEDISGRVYSTLQNPNVLAEYLLLVIPLAAACVFTAKSRLKGFMYLCSCGIMCVCMVLTFSRGGWLGLIFAAAVFLVMLDRRFILLGIAGAVLLIIAAPDVIVQRFTSIGNLSDGSTSYRVSIWLGTIQMLKDYWLTGIGPGTAAFNMVYPHYGYNTITAPHSHNLFLQIVCDSGICGIVIFLILIIVFIRMVGSANAKETDRTAKIFQISSMSGIGGFLLQSMTDYSFYNYRVMYLFWMFIALSTMFCRMGSMKER